MKKASDYMVPYFSGIKDEEQIKHQKAVPDGTKRYVCEHDHGWDHHVESQARRGELRILMVGHVLHQDRCCCP
jgi:hypothetical protein